MKEKVELKHYHLKNILIKLDHTLINFTSSKDTEEEHVMYLKSDNIEIIITDKADEVIEKLFQSLLSRCQIGLETPMRGSNFIFGCIHLLYYKCHKINFK